ncbi:MAG: prolyl oligopeptidase family serine peptidase [Planctomycetota bacterium]|nr:prolyl oligopeptidase family serine peptidase [Planctomycetota bacterium]
MSSATCSLAVLLCAALWFANAAQAGTPEVHRETLKYKSSVDGIEPLQADLALVLDGKPKPLLVVMHGYGGNRKNMAADLNAHAPRGLVAVAPDMRGAGGSAGKFDSGGLEIHDILDAVLETLKKYPTEIDPRNLNIVGYSGGGGNAIACMVRFPDLFQSCTSFFGISDYAAWNRSGGRKDCNASMERALGGGPDQQPEIYLARNFIPAAGNARAGSLHFAWDSQEAQCPPKMIEDFIAACKQAGVNRLQAHVSKPGDKARWVHGYRPAGEAADALFLPDVLAPKPASPALPPSGRLVVPGFLVTRAFAVWIGDAKKGDVRGQVTIEYDLRKQPMVKVVENAKNYPVGIEASPLALLPK